MFFCFLCKVFVEIFCWVLFGDVLLLGVVEVL